MPYRTMSTGQMFKLGQEYNGSTFSECIGEALNVMEGEHWTLFSVTPTFQTELPSPGSNLVKMQQVEPVYIFKKEA